MGWTFSLLPRSFCVIIVLNGLSSLEAARRGSRGALVPGELPRPSALRRQGE